MDIYALRDPRTGSVRYIGKANNAQQRFVGHSRDAARRNTPLYQWWRSLAQLPVLEVIETVDPSNWVERERYWIAAYRLSDDLLNVAPGGNQPYCPREVRARNGATNSRTRVDTPFKKRIYELKRALMQAHRLGQLPEGTKIKLRYCARKRPDLFACFAAI
jgi:hypothetical protein